MATSWTAHWRNKIRLLSRHHSRWVSLCPLCPYRLFMLWMCHVPVWRAGITLHKLLLVRADQCEDPVRAELMFFPFSLTSQNIIPFCCSIYRGSPNPRAKWERDPASGGETREQLALIKCIQDADRSCEPERECLQQQRGVGERLTLLSLAYKHTQTVASHHYWFIAT